MAVLGLVMIAIFIYIRAVPYRRLGRAVKVSDWPLAAAALTTIRQWVALNMGLGIVVTVIAVMG